MLYKKLLSSILKKFPKQKVMESKVVLSGALAVVSTVVLVFSSQAIDDGSDCMNVCLEGCASADNPKLLITYVNNWNSRCG